LLAGVTGLGKGKVRAWRGVGKRAVLYKERHRKRLDKETIAFSERPAE